ncbi:MAG: tyrosine-type recombinase/integrase [Pelolinea sp.]|nr:tyrosine-type recombinase/integrase [Pelolinea sp.]
MELEKALQGLILSKIAEGKSPHTIKVYQYGIAKLARHLGNPEIQAITNKDIQFFFFHLRQETNLSENSLINVWRAIRVLFSWAEKELGTSRPDEDMPYPKAPIKLVIPFTDNEIRRLISACNFTSASYSNIRKAFTMKRPTADRDKAIILTLLDTGVRVSELARLSMQDLNLETGEIQIRPFGSGLKSKPRTVYIGKLSRSTLWRFLAGKHKEFDDFIFTTHNDYQMNRTSIRQLLARIGEKAEILHVYPHRFRHTFAIQYLRNGGDIFTLQRILGHSSLEMVKRYLAIAKADCETAHRKASPVDNWKL